MRLPQGDALGATNTQEYGFQFGLKAPPSTTDAFTVHTRILGPFNGLTPQDNQSMGLFVGTGDQDNYVKIVTAANGGSGGIQFTKEVGGTVTVRPGANVTLPGPDYVDLYLRIDPDAATVQPRYAVTAGGVTGPLTDLGGSEPVPSGWFTGSTGLAIGIISTSSGPGVPFPATWDFIEAVPETVTDPSAIAQDTFTRTVTNSWGTADIGGPWTVIAGAAANFDVDGARGTVATPGGSQQQAAHLGQVSVRDVDLRVALTFPDAPTASGNFFGYLLLRRQANGSYYRVGLYVTPGGKVFIRGQTSAGANLFPDVDTGLSFAAGDTFLLRVQAEGASPTTIRARAWEQGTAEPASWQATATNATAGLQQAGSVGIRTVNTTSTATTLRFDDLLGKELQPVVPPPIAQDTFTRTVTNSWGTADIGGPWTVIAGAAANFDVDGARGTVATPGGSQQQAAHLGQVSVRDVDLRVALTFPDAPTASGNFFGYLLLRRQANGSNYRVGLYVTPGGKVFIRGQTNAGANLFPDVDTGLSFAAGDTFLLRVQAEGASPTTIRARAWEQGTAEPASWQATATDTTAGLQQAGSVGIRTVNLSSTATTLRFDDLAATSI